MSDPVQEQLLGHLLGALEESEEAEVAARLKNDPILQRELAQVRQRADVLEPGRCDCLPPPGLAQRTVRLVASRAESATLGRHRVMSPTAAAPSAPGRFRWLDVAVAAGIFVAASLLIGPAIQSSRSNARLVACQGNLQQIGVAMNQYSQQHNGYFPYIPPRGRFAVAGIYAPTLLRGGFMTDSRWFVCPGSSLAGRKGYRVSSLDELRVASREKLDDLIRWIGGSYGYHLGHKQGGIYQGTQNLQRTYFALAADAPGNDPLNGRQSPNHGGRGQNVLLEYGGVRFITSPRPYPRADDIFVNKLDIVAAGLDFDDSVIGSSAARPIIIVIGH